MSIAGKKSPLPVGMDGVEVVAPVAPSPLDSMRGRGKTCGLSHEKYATSDKKRQTSKSIVILVLPEKQTKPIVGHKHG